jgi:exopolysaccharide biosynthesis polyprenyl glycosylphosphotransferase
MNLSRRDQYSIQALQLLDALVIFLGFWLAVFVRNFTFDLLPAGSLIGRLFNLPRPPIGSVAQVAPILYIVVPFTPLVLEMFGFYQGRTRKSFVRSLSEIVKALATITLVVSIIAAALQFPEASRGVLFFGIFISVILLILREQATIGLRRRMLQREDLRLPLVLAGTGGHPGRYWSEADDETLLRWRVAGEFDPTAAGPDDLEQLLRETSAHRVVFLPDGVEFGKLAAAVERCELQGVEAWIAASFIQARIAQPTFDYMGDRAMLVLRSTPALSWALLAKGIMDWAGAALTIAATLPLWVVAAVGIKLSSPGPVFFRQWRGGRYGKPYRMWKFRTMVVDAEDKLAEVKEEVGNEMSGPVFKHEDDPRIFPFGRWLRRFSIDELPQLLNVLLGDMSLVGPRPLPSYEVQAIGKSEHRRRMSVKPGITCIWQVEGRNTITEFEDWVRLDLEYIDNWSLWLDIKLLLQTVPAVLFGRGAK